MEELAQGEVTPQGSAREREVPRVNEAPAHEPKPERQIWSIGGGKGGIGKSLLTASLGWQLAQLGKRVLMVDADLGGANLHTCLGIPNPERTLGDFIRRQVAKIEDIAVETGVSGLRLISGASDF